MAKNQKNNELTPDIGCLPIIALLALTAAALVACTPKSVEMPTPVAHKSIAPAVIQNGGHSR